MIVSIEIPSHLNGVICAGGWTTSIGQQVLLDFVSAVLQHVGHVLSHLLQHTVKSRERCQNPSALAQTHIKRVHSTPL